MADSWGGSWGISWGISWGSSGPPVPPSTSYPACLNIEVSNLHSISIDAVPLYSVSVSMECCNG